MSWWSHSQQAPVIGAKVAADQALTLHKSSLCTNLWRRLGRELWPGSSVHAEVNRDLFGTCHFTQERTEDGRRRRLVRKATLGEGQAGQISDTGEWLSRRPVIPRKGSLRRRTSTTPPPGNLGGSMQSAGGKDLTIGFFTPVRSGVMSSASRRSSRGRSGSVMHPGLPHRGLPCA